MPIRSVANASTLAPRRHTTHIVRLASKSALPTNSSGLPKLTRTRVGIGECGAQISFIILMAHGVRVTAGDLNTGSVMILAPKVDGNVGLFCWGADLDRQASNVHFGKSKLDQLMNEPYIDGIVRIAGTSPAKTAARNGHVSAGPRGCLPLEMVLATSCVSEI